MNFCGEISYDTPEGGVHSDICWHTENPIPLNENYIKFLHDSLDEWLTKSNGTGGFWIGDPKHFVGWGG